ncbi:ParA family protein [Clostridium butyricum]
MYKYERWSCKKTTLTINVAKRLSELGNKVLVVDMDPQFNATQSLLLYGTSYYNISKDSDLDEKLLEEETKSSEFYQNLSDNKKTVLQMFESSNIDKPLDNASVTQNICKNLYLIPGDLTMAKEIAGDTSGKVGAVFNHFADNNILKDYKYILIDCPPTWSILTHASLFASDYYVIPSKVDLYSSIGIKLLEQQINEKIYMIEYIR